MDIVWELEWSGLRGQRGCERGVCDGIPRLLEWYKHHRAKHKKRSYMQQDEHLFAVPAASFVHRNTQEYIGIHHDDAFYIAQSAS